MQTENSVKIHKSYHIIIFMQLKCPCMFTGLGPATIGAGVSTGSVAGGSVAGGSVAGGTVVGGSVSGGSVAGGAVGGEVSLVGST